MPQIVFAPFRIRVPQQYLVGEESPGLKAFRRLLPPFIHVEVVQPGTPEYDDLRVHSVAFDAGENFTGNVIKYMSRIIDDRMGEATKEFYTSTSGDSFTRDADGKKLGIQMIKAMIAETIEVEECDYVDGVTKVYVIHPPQLEDEIQCHLSALPVPAISASRSERLISIAVGQEMRHFVVEPYKMDLTRRRSTDPRWLIVHLYNPDRPALGIRVEAQGPLTFKEPTPLLSDTKVAEEWAMGVIQSHLREAGVGVRCVCYEPNGPKTFPDYRARLNGTPWDFEITRVLGDILENRHILDQPRDARRNMDMAVQSPPIDEKDVATALDRAIKSKEGKDQSDGITRSLCLVLLNALDLDIGSQSNVWEDIDLTSFHAVILVNGYSRPSVELIKGRF
jgi:hypothetical protein